jgi:hypothetical protein
MKLEEWIENYGTTYNQFAKDIGITIPTLNRLRSGNMPDMVNVIRNIQLYTKNKVMLEDICDISKVLHHDYKKDQYKKKKQNKSTLLCQSGG